MKSIAELKELASQVAIDLAATPGAVPDDLRARFITVRAALFTRGIFDPVLVRFDTASAPRASTAEVAEQLKTIVASLV